MEKVCVLICCAAIIFLLVIATLDLLAIPKQLTRIADALELLAGRTPSVSFADSSPARGEPRDVFTK